MPVEGAVERNDGLGIFREKRSLNANENNVGGNHDKNLDEDEEDDSSQTSPGLRLLRHVSVRNVAANAKSQANRVVEGLNELGNSPEEDGGLPGGDEGVLEGKHSVPEVKG